MLGKNTRGINNVPTIDDIDPSLTPSLVGYWKCDEGRGNVLHDSSGNGYDLTIECRNSSSSTEQVCDMFEPLQENKDLSWSRFDGFWTPADGLGAMITATGTLLDTQDKFVVWGSTQMADFSAGNADFDVGTYWAGGTVGDNIYTPASGFNWACSITQHWFRVAWEEAGSMRRAIIADTSGIGTFPNNTPIPVVGAFLPSTSMKAALGNSTVATVTKDLTGVYNIPPSLVAQNGEFGVRAQNGYDHNSGFQNLFVWAFDSEPAHLTQAMQYLIRNPGKIPPWWIGK